MPQTEEMEKPLDTNGLAAPGNRIFVKDKTPRSPLEFDELQVVFRQWRGCLISDQ